MPTLLLANDCPSAAAARLGLRVHKAPAVPRAAHGRVEGVAVVHVEVVAAPVAVAQVPQEG